MIVTLNFMVGVVIIFLITLAIVVAGIKWEPPWERLMSEPPYVVSAWARHVARRLCPRVGLAVSP